MKSFLTLRSVDDVLDMIGEFSPLPVEYVPIDEAAGRYLAVNFFAPEDIPGFDRSTVDGYAVRARDVFGASESSPALLRCVGNCPMGATPDIILREGETVSILTGGMLPEGADAVVMVEYSRPIGDNMVEFIRSQAPGDHVLLHDEDVKQGQLAIPAGRRLLPQEIGLLASLGQTQIGVHRRPKVSIISTGDEVIPFHEVPSPGLVRDVNSHSLASLCRNEGAIITGNVLVRDDREKLAASIRDGLEAADVVLVSGGSSAGMRDYTVEIFQSMPKSQLLVHGVSISPGKPFIFARSEEKSLIGLPGHIGGALICAHVFVRPLLQRLQDAESHIEPQVQATLTRAVVSTQGRRDYIRVRLTKKGNVWEADPILGPSGLISGLVQANAFVVCPENSEGLYAGQDVIALLLR
ncbi:MAG: molybdopterin molybdotransferase MoeA [Desulfovibrio sp.]|nr:molybdopterin molybdotransferase MoeA [Desulfovibrio sp.]